MDNFDINDIIEFFNALAADWDSRTERNEAAIRAILDAAGVREGTEVLDVACGTGVLIGDYLARGAAVTAIDAAPEMARRAQEKFPSAAVICGNVETWPFYREFDSVVVYNAFPHFPDFRRAVRVFASLTRPGGRLTIAHGMSLEALRACHSGSAHRVSREMLAPEELALIMRPYFAVDAALTDDEKYIVSGVKV